jgi:hypothetical protein
MTIEMALGRKQFVVDIQWGELVFAKLGRFERAWVRVPDLGDNGVRRWITVHNR